MTEIDAQALKKAEEFVEQEEGATHRFAGAWGVFLFACAVVMSLFHLYSAYGVITTTTLRYAHVGVANAPQTRENTVRLEWRARALESLKANPSFFEAKGLVVRQQQASDRAYRARRALVGSGGVRARVGAF